LALALPKLASACAVCFGQLANTPGLARGIKFGFFVLIGSVMTMLAGIGIAMVRLERRKLASEQGANP